MGGRKPFSALPPLAGGVHQASAKPAVSPVGFPGTLISRKLQNPSGPPGGSIQVIVEASVEGTAAAGSIAPQPAEKKPKLLRAVNQVLPQGHQPTNPKGVNAIGGAQAGNWRGPGRFQHGETPPPGRQRCHRRQGGRRRQGQFQKGPKHRAPVGPTGSRSSPQLPPHGPAGAESGGGPPERRRKGHR